MSHLAGDLGAPISRIAVQPTAERSLSAAALHAVPFLLALTGLAMGGFGLVLFAGRETGAEGLSSLVHMMCAVLTLMSAVILR